MSDESPSTVVAKFNACINEADLEGLVALMTDDHAFIDSAGSTISGKQAVAAAWSAFFCAFPGYRSEFFRDRVNGDTIAIEGRSSCSDPRLDGPALWRARIRDGRVAAWQVYKDTPEMRRSLGL